MGLLLLLLLLHLFLCLVLKNRTVLCRTRTSDLEEVQREGVDPQLASRFLARRNLRPSVVPEPRMGALGFAENREFYIDRKRGGCNWQRKGLGERQGVGRWAMCFTLNVTIRVAA